MQPRALKTQSKNDSFSVMSWNCLADCYAHGSFARHIPDRSVLNWNKRFSKIKQVLASQNVDIVCLQEVDHYDEQYKPMLMSLNYTPFFLQRTGREDGVVIAVKSNRFDILIEDAVQFDDLAHGTRPGISEAQRKRFRKQNVALILLLRTKVWESHVRPRYLTACSAHLFWNPTMADVKLAQTRYLLERITFIRQPNGLPPSASILLGDFNSLPKSDIYCCILKGISFPTIAVGCRAGAIERAHQKLGINTEKFSSRFVCDDGLVRLARMLRLLGLDATIFNAMSGNIWSRKKAFSLFELARSEKRIVVTQNTRTYLLLNHKECPETYFIPSSDRLNLEKSLVDLLTYYNIELDKADILSACAKCGGRIELCSNDDPRISEGSFPKDRQLLICGRCYQVYWESDSTNGLSSKARRAAERLFAMVHNSRNESKGAPKNPDISEISNTVLNDCNCALPHYLALNGNDQAHVGNVDAAEDIRSNHHWLKYFSAFAQCNGEEPKCTNINGDFRGTLDYIFFGGAITVLDSSLVNCTSDSIGNRYKSYPHQEWPSDHMLLTATLSFTRDSVGRPSFARTLSSPS